MKWARKNIYVFFIFLCIPLSAVCWSDDSNPDDQKILIGLIPEQNIFKQMERYKPLAEYLSRNLGTKIKLTILSKYGDVIDRFNSRAMNGAFFGDLTAVIAYEKLGLIPIATVVNSDGSDYIVGHIIVRNDGLINSLSDLRGKVIAFVDRASVSGYLFPIAFLKKNGISYVDSFFSEAFYTGSYDASVYAVLDGRADVGCVKDTVLRNMIKSDVTIEKELKIIATSPKMPNISLSLGKDVSPQIREKIKDLLLGISESHEGKRVLQNYGAQGFKKTDIGDFEAVYRLLKETGIRIKDYKYKIQ